jgi:hypothetical protein
VPISSRTAAGVSLDYAKLLDLGVTSFATDHPDVAIRELKACYAAKGTPK